MKKLKKGILLVLIFIIPIIMIYHVQHNKKQLEDFKNGKIQIEEGYIPPSDVHPEGAYLWILPYMVLEVGIICVLSQ